MGAALAFGIWVSGYGLPLVSISAAALPSKAPTGCKATLQCLLRGGVAITLVPVMCTGSSFLLI